MILNVRKAGIQRSFREMGLKNKRAAIIVVGTILVSLALSVWILRPSDRHIVEVLQEDVVLYTFDLDSAENHEFTVYYENGSSNTIRIRDGKICISEAQCPDKTCVKMGELRSKSLPIVCLPNRLIIRFAE